MDDGAVAVLVRHLVRAWNEGPPAAFAALFTPHADYVGADAVRRQGRAAIQEMRRAAVDSPRVAIRGPISVRSYADVATALFRWSTREGAERAREGAITCVAVRRKGRWMIERLHNTDSPFTPRARRA